MSEADSYIAKWLAREPEMELAQVFCPVAERPLFALWGALLNELDEAVFDLSEASIAQAKLAWWGDELVHGARGAARHPLVREFFMQSSTRAVDSATWPRLAHAATVVALDERVPSDTAASLARYRPYCAVLGSIESTLFGVATPTDALALHQILRQWPQGNLSTKLRWPLQLLARHQIGAGEVHAAAGERLRCDFAAELLVVNEKTPGGALYRRCRSALDGWRLRQLAAGPSTGRITGRWRALWLLWRAARSDLRDVETPPVKSPL